jgi:hypothetical protein
MPSIASDDRLFVLVQDVAAPEQATPRLKQRFAETLTTVATEAEATPAHHAQFLASEIARLRPLILAAGQFAD